MQALYSYLQSSNSDVKKLEKDLLKDIDKIYDLYLYLLELINSIGHVAFQAIEERKNKKLPTPEDLNPNKKFIENAIFKAISQSKDFENKITNKKLSWQNDMDLVRKIYNEFKNSDTYKTYMATPDNSLQADRELIVIMLVDFIAENDILNDHFEDKNIHWSDDIFIAINTLIKTIEHIDSKNKLMLPDLFKSPEDDKDFIHELLSKCLQNQEYLGTLISDKTKNWDPDRIAFMDLLLMKMALTEIIYFQQIPVKVALNEYIEISKQYSTPKSKLFINGVLDKIVLDLKTQDKILKTGRGLLEN